MPGPPGGLTSLRWLLQAGKIQCKKRIEIKSKSKIMIKKRMRIKSGPRACSHVGFALEFDAPTNRDNIEARNAAGSR